MKLPPTGVAGTTIVSIRSLCPTRTAPACEIGLGHPVGLETGIENVIVPCRDTPRTGGGVQIEFRHRVKGWGRATETDRTPLVKAHPIAGKIAPAVADKQWGSAGLPITVTQKPVSAT